MARYRQALFDTDFFESLIELRDLCKAVKHRRGKLMIAGNGASAAIASHVAGDLTKQAGVTAMTFHDPDLITMMANDHGYEYWVAKCIEAYHRSGDVVILISSSGRSKNIINAAKTAKSLSLPVVAFYGFERNGPLLADSDLQFWLDSKAYNVIENTHSIWLTTVIDMLVGIAEYSVKQ